MLCHRLPRTHATECSRPHKLIQPPQRMSDSVFLSSLDLRTVAPLKGCPFSLSGLALGKGASPLEVLVASSKSQPPLPDVRAAWRERQGGRAAPLLLAVEP